MTQIKKFFFFFSALIFILLFLVTAFLPSFLSSDLGKNLLLNLVNSRISGEVQVKKLSLSWLDGQLVEEAKLKNHYDKEILSVQLLSSSRPLWQWLIFGWHPAHIQLVDLNSEIVQDSRGVTNIEKALQVYQNNQESEDSYGFPLFVSEVNGHLNLREDGEAFVAKLTGKTLQDKLSGHFTLEGTALWDHKKVMESVDDLTIAIDIVDFPVDLLDQLVSMNHPKLKGVIRSALGPAISAKIKENQKGSVASTNWKVFSDNLHIVIDGELDPLKFQLTEPAKVKLAVTEDLISLLTHNQMLDSSLEIKKPAILTIDVQELFLPFKNASRKELGVDLAFDLSKMEITGTSLPKNFILQRISGNIKAPQNQSEMSFSLEGNASDQGEDTIQLKVNANFKKPESMEKFIDELKEKAEVQIEAKSIPSYLFQAAVSSPYNWSDLLGNKIDFSINGVSNKREAFFSLLARSDKLNIEKASFSIDQSIKLEEPFKIQYTLTPNAFQDVLGKDIGVTLRSPARFQLVFNEFIYPFSFPTPAPDFPIDMHFYALSEVELESMGKTLFSLENSVITLKGDSLEQIQSTLSTGIVSSHPSSPINKALGSTTQINLAGEIALNDRHSLQLRNGTAQIESHQLKLNAQGDLRHGELELSSPATIDYTLTPDLLQNVLPTASSHEVEENITLQLTVAPAHKTLNIRDLSKLDLSGHLSIPLIPIKFGEEKITLRDVMIPWEINGYEKKVKLTISGSSYYPSNSQKGSFKGKFVVKDWQESPIFSSANYKVRLGLINFPSEILFLIDKKSFIPSLIGGPLQAEIDAFFSSTENEGNIDLTLESEDFLMKGALTLHEQLSLKTSKDPLTLDMKLTPERFLAISHFLRPKPKHPVKLLQDSHFKAKISYLNLPINEFAIPLWNAGIKLNAELDEMIIRDVRGKRDVPFNKMKLKIDTEDLSSSLKFHASTNPSPTTNGKILIDGVVKDALKRNGELNLEDLSIDAKFLTEELNSKAFCQLFCPFPTMENKLQALIGDPINADVQVQITKMKGPLFGTLQGSNGHATINGYVKNGFFLLNEPFVAKVKASKELGKYVLSDVAPFLSSLEESTTPLTLGIDPKGFAFPIKNFNRQDISIGLLSLDMGKMTFRNTGEIQAILGLLGNTNNEIVPVWVTPLYIRMSDGKIQLERVDMLLNNLYPVAAWGGVNLVKEKISMILGISGYALHTALGLEVTPDYLLQVPLKGSLKQPKIDTKRAAAKISALVAQSQGAEGLVISTVLDIASGGLSESKPPPPTTYPLPWSDQLPKYQQSKPEKKAIEAPKEKIKEGAQKLIKKIFKK